MSIGMNAPFEIGAPISVPDPPRIPRLRLRHYRGPADHPGMVRANNVSREAAGIVDRVSVEGMDSDYANLTNSDPYRDVIIAETDEGIVAYGRLDWGDHTDGGRDYTSFCLLEPSVRRRGLGRAMLGWQEARLGEVAAGHETDRPRWYFAFVNDGDAGGIALLQSAGYAVVRRGAEMVRPDLADIPDASLPDGVVYRTASAADARAAWEANVEIFRDDWGAVNESEESYAGFVASPRFSPSLWVVARDGDDIAGLVITSIQAPDESGAVVGYLESVGVRRPWRRRGVGRAIVTEALRVLRDRGATTVGLGVDLENQNEAARLYESVGFRIETTNTMFRKPLVLPDRGGSARYQPTHW